MNWSLSNALIALIAPPNCAIELPLYGTKHFAATIKHRAMAMSKLASRHFSDIGVDSILKVGCVLEIA